MEIDDGLVESMAQWISKFNLAQKQYDFLIIANYAGIADWDEAIATDLVKNNSQVFSIGHHEFMTKFNMLSMTKSPREQGVWAAKVAIELLSGKQAKNIPIVTNRKWNIFANEFLLNKSKLTLPSAVFRNANKITL